MDYLCGFIWNSIFFNNDGFFFGMFGYSLCCVFNCVYISYGICVNIVCFCGCVDVDENDVGFFDSVYYMGWEY